MGGWVVSVIFFRLLLISFPFHFIFLPIFSSASVNMSFHTLL